MKKNTFFSQSPGATPHHYGLFRPHSRSVLIQLLALSLVLLVAAFSLLGSSSAQAVNYYWDENGATAGFGTAGASGVNWSPTTSLFTTDQNGTTAPIGTQTTTTNDTVFFGTNTLGLGAGVITVSGTVTASNITFGSASGAITISGGTINLGTLNTITFTANNAADTISSTLTGGASTQTLTIAGTGTITLSGANTFIRAVTVNTAKLSVSSIGSVGSASSNLGAPTTAANGTINMLGNGTLIYTGAGETSDRVLNLSSGAGSGGIIDQSGTGLLRFTGGVTSSGASSKTLTLTGSTSGTGEISGTIADNSTTNKTSVTKSGTSTWTLSGANTYTGATTISAGTLALSGAAERLDNTSSMVLSGGTFSTGGLTETLGTLTLTNGTASTIDLGSGASVLRYSGFGTGTGTVNVTNYTSGSDQLFIGTTGTLTTAQLSQIRFVNPNGTTTTFSATQNSATGEITPSTPSTGGALISEFRLQGPNGIRDEFVEIYNNTDSTLDPTGWRVAPPAATGVSIPAGNLIPARGHLLLTNNTAVTGYSLGSVAGGDVAYFQTEFTESTGITLFNAANTVVDAVGFVGGGGLEGGDPGLPASGATTEQHSYVRRYDFSTFRPVDTNNSLNDFELVSTTGGVGGGTPSNARLGAPGPENRTSPTQKSASAVAVTALNTGVAITSPPNREKRATVVPNGPLGTLILRRTITNNTGAPITAMRLRAVLIPAGTVPVLGQSAGTGKNATPGDEPNDSTAGVNGSVNGTADLRLISISDADATTGSGVATVLGTTLQEPTGLTQANGGGYNSTVSVALPGGSLAPGASVNVAIQFGGVKGGTFVLQLNIETLP